MESKIEIPIYEMGWMIYDGWMTDVMGNKELTNVPFSHFLHLNESNFISFAKSQN